MFLMYVDECGDSGMSIGSSRYFILSGMVVHESMWTDLLTMAYDEIAGLKIKHRMHPHAEIHAKSMLGRSDKKYTTMNKLQRVLFFRDLFKFEKQLVNHIRLINVMVDKTNKSDDFDVFKCAWNALINRFENTIQNDNFPIIAPNSIAAQPEHGMIIVDETDEKRLRHIIRNMRHNNNVPSNIFPGTTIKHNLMFVIEDAMHRDSQHSIPIQMCDANAYFLRQLIEPNTTVRKYDAQNYFYLLEPILLKEASRKDKLGIVKL